MFTWTISRGWGKAGHRTCWRSEDVTNLYNQEMREYIVTEHNAELINKDQPSMEDVI